MKDAVLEKAEFPGTSTGKRDFWLQLQGVRAVSTEKPSRMPELVAAVSPTEDEKAALEPTQWPEADDETWSEEKNRRRCDLIDRKYAGNLTSSEALELRWLQQEMSRHRRRIAPLPLEEARRLHRELLDGGGDRH